MDMVIDELYIVKPDENVQEKLKDVSAKANAMQQEEDYDGVKVEVLKPENFEEKWISFSSGKSDQWQGSREKYEQATKEGRVIWLEVDM